MTDLVTAIRTYVADATRGAPLVQECRVTQVGAGMSSVRVGGVDIDGDVPASWTTTFAGRSVQVGSRVLVVWVGEQGRRAVIIDSIEGG